MDKERLYILWTTGDPVTSEHMVLMYATNALLNGWWDEVTVILWGAPQKLARDNDAIKLKMEVAEEAGVNFSACLSCAINLGTREYMENAGIEVIKWGEKLSGLIKSGEHVLTV
ncbi:MAG: DsrE family protein [Eubacteriaceae bacterium]|nr:DsrE family protein [Eubacteriaceae bacterium]